jgi:transposase
LNSKLHLVCDGAGRPVSITVSAGNEADISHARQCLEPVVRNGTTVITDRGYDADHLREWLRDCKAKACIPPRGNRKKKARYSKTLYKIRNLVERCFNRIKDWRALSLRTFRCPETFLASVKRFCLKTEQTLCGEL